MMAQKGAVPRSRYGLCIRMAMLVALAGDPLAAEVLTQPCAPQPDGRPTVGLVLSGGGARGAAHIGVLRVLEQHRIPVDCIAGTSMGAIIGGLYAAGLSIDELEATLLSVDWKAVFKDQQPRQDRSFNKKLEDEEFLVKLSPGLSDGEFKFPKGLVQGQSLGLLLTALTERAGAINDFDRLRVPFRAVATDLGNGRAVALASGSLAAAMQASMSVPGALAPVEMQGALLVDGGVSNNVPVDVARAMGAEVLIVVSIGTPLYPTSELDSAFAITEQLTTIMTQQNTRIQLATLRAGDVLIEPDLGDISTADFSRAAEAIPIGEAATEAQLDVLAGLVLSSSRYAELQASRPRPDAQLAPRISFVELNNRSALDNEVLLSRIRQRPGQLFDREQLEQDLAVIYGLGIYERVDYELEQRDHGTGVVISALDKSWGPGFVQFGLSIEDDLEGSAGFNVAAAYTRTGINGLGADWRTTVQVGDRPGFATRFRQPLDVDSRYFIEPWFFGERYKLGLFGGAKETPLSVYRVSQAALSLQGGREFGTWGELRFGYTRGVGDTDVLAGPEVEPTEKFDIGRLFARFSTDTLDNRYFPRQGHKGALTYTTSRKSLGASTGFDTLTLTSTLAYRWGRHVLSPGLAFGTTTSGDLPLQDRFTLGGFLNLSGFSRGQLSGRHFGLARAVYYYRLVDSPGPLDVPVYLGGSLELGNTWEDRDEVSFDSLLLSGSAFVGIDTFLGPLYLAGGLAEGGQTAYYFFLGKAF